MASWLIGNGDATVWLARSPIALHSGLAGERALRGQVWPVL